MTTFAAGQPLTAALLEQFVPLFVEKGADESVTSDTTAQNDDELFLVVPPGTWTIRGELWILGTSASAQDVKIGFAFPTGDLTWSIHGYDIDWTSGASASDTLIGGVPNATSSPTAQGSWGLATAATLPLWLSGRMVNTAAGTLQMQWAQNTSNVTATTVAAGSWIELRRAVISA